MVTSNYFSEILSDNLLQDWVGTIFRERFDIDVQVEFTEDYFCLIFSKNDHFVTINFTDNGRQAFFSKENTLSYNSYFYYKKAFLIYKVAYLFHCLYEKFYV